VAAIAGVVGICVSIACERDIEYMEGVERHGIDVSESGGGGDAISHDARGGGEAEAVAKVRATFTPRFAHVHATNVSSFRHCYHVAALFIWQAMSLSSFFRRRCR